MTGQRRRCEVTSDRAAQAVYIRLAPGKVATTPEVPIVCNLDLDKDGKPLGIELVGLVVDLGPEIQVNIHVANVPAEVRIVPVPVWPNRPWLR